MIPHHHERLKIPLDQVSQLWGQAQVVCFDVDGTITKNDALNDLANFLSSGSNDVAHKITNEPCTDDLDEVFQRQLEIIAPTVDELTSYIQNEAAQTERFVPGIQQLIGELQARKVEIFLISDGFHELILPVADLLNVPQGNIYANRLMNIDDKPIERNDPETRVSGIVDLQQGKETGYKSRKAEAIQQIRRRRPLQTVVVVGGGISAVEAVREAGGADLFIGYGGVRTCTKVVHDADFFVSDYKKLIDMLPRLKVAVIGSGAFASACMQMISENASRKPLFQDQVDMYVYEEQYESGLLSERINQLHENPKYLPGVKFGSNVVANPSLQDSVRGADVLVFCAPHQFMHSLCKQIQLEVKPNAIALSLTKGIHIAPEGPQLMSHMIHRMLRIPCSVMMGANIASEIKPGGLCESTIGTHSGGEVFQELFNTNYFTTSVITDIEGAELAGALKNVVAIAAGLADGCEVGENAKAALLRQGLTEMRHFSKAMFSTVRDETFFESCGIADLIATCYGGRNHKVAMEFAKQGGKTTFQELETVMLRGQKLQGVLTSEEVQTVLDAREWQRDYPLFTAVHAISTGLASPLDIVRFRDVAKEYTRRIKGPSTGGNDESARLSLLEKQVNV